MPGRNLFNEKRIPWVTYGLIFSNVALFLYRLSIGSSLEFPQDTLDWGANFAPYTLGDEWWRLITSMFLHFGWIHLIVNMYALFVLGRKLEQEVGPLTFSFIYLLTGIAGSIASIYWNLFVFSMGASGAIFGLYGFEIILLLFITRNSSKEITYILINFVLYVAFITFLGTQFAFDNAAHFGGLAAGAVLAVCYLILRSSWQLLYSGFAVFLFLIIVLFLKLPLYQKHYFEAFQNLVDLEADMTKVYEEDYSSDRAFFQALESTAPGWDSVYMQFDTLNVPEDLRHDQALVREFVEMNNKEIYYMLTGIQRESYIYYDSIEYVRSQKSSLDSLQYPLKIGEVDTTEQKPPPEPPGKFAQVYYDSSWRPVDSKWTAAYYRLGYKDSLGRWNGPARDYYINGDIQMKGVYDKDLRDGVFIYYSDHLTYEAAGLYDQERKVGKWEYFHDNGEIAKEVRYSDRAYVINAWDENGNQLIESGDGSIHEKYWNGITKSYTKYIDGLEDSVAYGYHNDGDLFFKEWYQEGRLISGIAYDQNNNKVIYDYSTYIPHPVGGMDNFRKYVQDAKPKDTNALKGAVELIFTVSEEGEVYNVKVLKSDTLPLVKLARDILISGPPWFPAKEHGIKPILSEGYVEMQF
ncbi:MAG: rhomboid family intramembrane serine protease [Fulvivirga sp.]|nr:rhomboid family intramembrane serine protease [Fulvivirga sp.]